MNIFFLHENPVRAATWLWETNPKRARKMIIETAQILSTVCSRMHTNWLANKASKSRQYAIVSRCSLAKGWKIVASTYESHPIMQHDYSEASLEWLLIHGMTLLYLHDAANEYSADKPGTDYAKPRELYKQLSPVVAGMTSTHCDRVAWQLELNFIDCARNEFYGIDREPLAKAHAAIYRRYLWLRENFNLLFPACRTLFKRPRDTMSVNLYTVAEHTRFDWLIQSPAMPLEAGAIDTLIRQNTFWLTRDLVSARTPPKPSTRKETP
jgi:hypothetical protein